MKRLFVVMIAMVLAACSQKGSEYIGKWQSAGAAPYTIEIERNGENFMANISAPADKHSPASKAQAPATLKDGQLQFAGQFAALTITYVKDKDILFVPGMNGSEEFKRVK